ncbi:MAG: hypothetical protein DYG89_48150 [Caldilinea sp. CFX5]|nr:hypothetical protein [Caldilinea sp. CFX5]
MEIDGKFWDDDKNKLRWNLPMMSAGDIFQRNVQLQIAKLNQALKRGVGALTATVDAPGYSRMEAATLLAFAPAPPSNEDTLDDTGAMIASSDGDVVLLAPPAAAPNGVRFRYTDRSYAVDGRYQRPVRFAKPDRSCPTA